MTYLEVYDVLRSIIPKHTALTMPLPDLDRKKLISLLRHDSVNEVLQGLRYTNIVYRLNDCICMWHIDTMVVLAREHIDVYKKKWSFIAQI